MNALLLAAAFTLTPQPPRVIEIVRPLDDAGFGLPSDHLVERIGSWKLSPDETARLRAELARPRLALCGPITPLDILHREGGFASGFAPLPPDAVPAVPLPAAGFWSPRDNWRVPPPGRFGAGGMGDLRPGGGRGGLGGGRGGGRPLTSGDWRR